MAISKVTKTLNVPWEQEYGYSQAVKVGDTIFVAGQLSHDEEGNLVGIGEMESQMRQSYANVAKVLAQYGATVGDIVDEVLFVTDMEAAFAASVKCRREIFGGPPRVASTIVQVQRLAFPEQLIEIKCVAKV